MSILFFKARQSSTGDHSEAKEPLPDKIRAILISRIEEAESDDDREWVERELNKFEAGRG